MKTINLNNKYNIEVRSNSLTQLYSLIELSSDREVCCSFNVYSFIVKAKQYTRISKQLEKQLIKEV